MIKTAGTHRLVRECTAPFQYVNDSGDTVTEEITVKYYVRSVGEIKQQQATFNAMGRKDPNRMVWLSETLALTVHSLPGVAGQDGKPIISKYEKDGMPTPATIANFDGISRSNLEAIRDAIHDDLSPKDTPSN